MNTPVIQRGKAIIKRLPQSAIIAEIGVLTGNLSRYILDSTDCKLIMVDSWAPAEEHPASYHSTNDDHSKHTLSQVRSIESIARNTISGYPERVTILKEWSDKAARLIPDRSLDMVFLDADHSYEGVHRDIIAWKSKVKPGGYIGGHDYDNPDPRFKFEVKRAVHDVFPVVEIDENFTWFVRL